jgi:plastocyanin
LKTIALASGAVAAAAALLVAIPALAATPTYKGTVGPGFTITMASKPTKAGAVKLVIADKSNAHNFHLTGPGVNVKTSVPAVGSKTFTVTLKKGTYKFICDPHPFMKGSFTVK